MSFNNNFKNLDLLKKVITIIELTGNNKQFICQLNAEDYYQLTVENTNYHLNVDDWSLADWNYNKAGGNPYKWLAQVFQTPWLGSKLLINLYITLLKQFPATWAMLEADDKKIYLATDLVLETEEKGNVVLQRVLEDSTLEPELIADELELTVSRHQTPMLIFKQKMASGISMAKTVFL